MKNAFTTTLELAVMFLFIVVMPVALCFSLYLLKDTPILSGIVLLLGIVAIFAFPIIAAKWATR